MSDEEILKLSYKKPSKFGELFDRHHKRFLRVANQNLRSKEDAEDVVQEAFVKIYKYGKKFPENGGRFIPWANTILRNCMADQIGKYKNIPISFTEEMEEVTPSQTNEEVLREVNKNYVQFVLKKIGGLTAEIINLRYMLGKSFKEIAKTLNIKNSTARVRVYRSKKYLCKFTNNIIIMNNSLKKRIMLRVYLQYSQNVLKEYPDYFMFAVFIIFSFISISLYDVFVNTTSIIRNDAFSVFSFFTSAILNTSWIIQAFILGFLIRTAYAGIKSISKNIRNTNWIMAKFRY